MGHAFCCELLEEKRSDLVGYFVRRGASRDDAEDAIQTVGLLWTRSATIIATDAPLWSYMVKSVGRALAMRRRRVVATVSLDSPVSAQLDDEGQPWHERMPDPRPGPEAVVVDAIAADAILRAVDGLPDPERQAVEGVVMGSATEPAGRPTLKRARRFLAMRLGMDG